MRRESLVRQKVLGTDGGEMYHGKRKGVDARLEDPEQNLTQEITKVV